MKNKTLASWSLGLTVAMVFGFTLGMADNNVETWNLIALAYFVFTVWASIRLYRSE